MLAKFIKTSIYCIREPWNAGPQPPSWHIILTEFNELSVTHETRACLCVCLFSPLSSTSLSVNPVSVHAVIIAPRVCRAH